VGGIVARGDLTLSLTAVIPDFELEPWQQVWSAHQDGDVKWRKNNQEIRKSGKERDRDDC
jgi:hypothetical protein